MSPSCSEIFVLFSMYFVLFCSSQTQVHQDSKQICDRMLPEASWNLYESEPSIALNINDLSASSWSQNGHSDITITSSALPLQLKPKDIAKDNFEGEAIQEQPQEKPREQFAKKRSSENTRNTGSLFMSLLRLVDFDANKLGSLSLNVLIMLGQMVTTFITDTYNCNYTSSCILSSYLFADWKVHYQCYTKWH